ncbi:3-isopropylmalate dehydratase, large subunit [Thermanaeromonas toyohensis ToBE]|uniref:3-isopropylmalate dehydratase large subunit n=1 Tax=Thermanaeromonas toyohensis ToBE TaxID=698762 RepID=A0A1W1VJH5_9FIRM|nr:3-isopropylmalate dehydratase large subunit [Thermanaeromonas toyohensis]SMB93433.1 3-isopropylmalate dehydratase, large subunit [Thermanaeromonas toyohensis ToBE]
MGMTMTEKILAAHAGLEKVEPGQLISCRIDLALGNDITAPLAIKEFRQLGIEKVFDPGRIVLVPDHFTPNKDIKSAEQAKLVREFAREQGVIYYEVGRLGIEHCLLPEEGLVVPGDLIIGADSHTCTYGALGAFATGVGSTDLAAAMATGECWFRVPESIKLNYYGRLKPWVGGKDLILYTIGDLGVDGARYKALEFTGEAIGELSLDSRFTMANMAIEAGAKNGIFPVDEKTERYLEGRTKRPYRIYQSDPDARYSEIREYDVSKIEPQVAFPHLPENTKGISEVGEIKIDQVVIGSCTNGRLEDLRIAAKILKGKKVHPEVRLIIIPGTQKIYAQAIEEGLITIFIEAGAAISTPTCGPCLGGHMGVLAKGEKAVATTNRNFVGRMGHPESEVYLAGPAVAAASAIKGRIAAPEEVL